MEPFPTLNGSGRKRQNEQQEQNQKRYATRATSYGATTSSSSSSLFQHAAPIRILPPTYNLHSRRLHQLFFSNDNDCEDKQNEVTDISMQIKFGTVRLKPVYKSPNIYIIDQFLSSNDIQYLFSHFISKYKFERSYVDESGSDTAVKIDDGEHEPADTKSKQSQKSYKSAYRTSSFLPLNKQHDAKIASIEQKVATLFCCGSKQIEALQLVRYNGPNQFFHIHHDLGIYDESTGDVELPHKSIWYRRRIVTIFCYLNTIPTQYGGATYFPYCTNHRPEIQVSNESKLSCLAVYKGDTECDTMTARSNDQTDLAMKQNQCHKNENGNANRNIVTDSCATVECNGDGLRIYPVAGRALVFSNILSSGLPDPRTIHAGEPLKLATTVVDKQSECRVDTSTCTYKNMDDNKTKSSKDVVCVQPETNDYPATNTATIPIFDRKFYETSYRALRKFIQVLIGNKKLSRNASIISSRNRVIRTETRNSVELQVYRGDDTCSTNIDYYELIEPLYLELGGKVYHVEDYAYSPVATVSVQSISDTDVEKIRKDSLEDSPTRRGWWQWWIPWRILRDRSSKFNSSRYKVNNEAFAGGSHGEVWRGRRKCSKAEVSKGICSEMPLIFQRLKVEKGFRTLEAGLREIHFGNILQQLSQKSRGLFTQYVEHFIGDDGELWIVFADHGVSLRSILYTATDAGGFIVFQQSWLWTLMRVSLHSHKKERKNNKSNCSTSIETLQSSQIEQTIRATSNAGKVLIRSILKQLLESVSVLHENGIVHRDIKPSNILCKSNIVLEEIQSLLIEAPLVDCVLGDFSSAYDDFTRRNLYTRGASGLEQTDEYAPPEAIFGYVYSNTSVGLHPSFDMWSVGIVALEILLGTPNVFSVDQRTRMVLAYKMRKKGASDDEIERAIYLAALSQFCIYNPLDTSQRDWPLRDGDPLHQSAMTKQTCTMTDFHRALRARDPLGWGFESSDSLLHLIWQLLAWDPKSRMSASDALMHQFFSDSEYSRTSDPTPNDHNALESQMLDPRMDFNTSDSISEFVCPKCGRTFSDWRSCYSHANSRKHSKFCVYDRSALPTCLNSHAMLPVHSFSGYCDIQGRRRTIEDFHAIHLLPNQQFYGIFDGHSGNFASKYVASFLYDEVATRLGNLTVDQNFVGHETDVERLVSDAFVAVHEKFLTAVNRSSPAFMDQSGTTATALLVTNNSVVVMSIGDSRAVMSMRIASADGTLNLVSKQLTKDHVASDKEEKELVESRGGRIIHVNGLDRVMGSLVVTRSIGDAELSPYLSRIPYVISMTKQEVLNACGNKNSTNLDLCFFILASDGLWDTVSNQEAIDMVEMVVAESVLVSNSRSWHETDALQQAAEALTHEAYVRGSTDNIGVCIVAVS